MTKITDVIARQVYDSRGNPTVEADIILNKKYKGSAIVPSGASTGAFEAYELRDNKDKFLGKSVFNAVKNINTKIKKKIVGKIAEQKVIDKSLIDLDSSENKKNLGANAILAVSLALSKAISKKNSKEIFKSLGKKYSIPYPLMNILNGGAHADNQLRIQEFMIRPDSAKNIFEAIEMCYVVIQNLKKMLIKNGKTTNVGDEGGFAPDLKTNEEALNLITDAIEKSNFKPGIDISICLDVAANELVDSKGKYKIKSDYYESPDEVINYYKKITLEYPIKSIEDPFAEEDWDSWRKLNKELGHKIQIVGDDLFVTNFSRLKRGIESKSANSILVKPNQIGTLSETLNVISLAKKNNFNTIISHRSGDTEDTFIADLAVSTQSSQIKTGSLARSERVAKYNRLVRIEEILGKSAIMSKLNI